MESFRETKPKETNINGNPFEENVKQSNLVRITSVVSKLSRKRSFMITSFRAGTEQKLPFQQLKVNTMIHQTVTTIHTKETAVGRLEFPLKCQRIIKIDIL